MRRGRAGNKESLSDIEAEAKAAYEKKSRELLRIVNKQQEKIASLVPKIRENEKRIARLTEEEVKYAEAEAKRSMETTAEVSRRELPKRWRERKRERKKEREKEGWLQRDKRLGYRE